MGNLANISTCKCRTPSLSRVSARLGVQFRFESDYHAAGAVKSSNANDKFQITPSTEETDSGPAGDRLVCSPYRLFHGSSDYSRHARSADEKI